MNIGDLFDSPWKILIIAALLIVFFGAAKLPVAARSLGKSMRILKREVQGLHEDDDEAAPNTTVQAAPAQIQAPAPAPAPAVTGPDTQAQLDALSKQLADLQRSVKSSDSAQAN
jgi:sec-independent protein translocase protein TatA